MSVAVSTVIADALADLNVIGPGGNVPAPMATFCLGKLNQIFDNWNAERQAVWASIFTNFTITPSLSPHTIGPSGATWTMTIRPVTLDGCDLILNQTTPNVYKRIAVVDAETYRREVSLPTLQSGIPTLVYYEADVPNGSLYFFPVPNVAYGVRLQTRTLLAQGVLTDTINFPPGYRNALTLTLEEDIASALGRPLAPMLVQRAAEARHRIFVVNIVVPVLITRAPGMQNTRGNASPFNYQDRSFAS